MVTHDALFKSYVKDLESVKSEVLSWWEDLYSTEIRSGRSRPEAEEALNFRWPMGAPTHPKVIEVYRRYYLACESLNEKLENLNLDEPKDKEDLWGSEAEDEEDVTDSEAYPVEPFELLKEWLLDEEYDELHLFISHLIFEPIGSDDV